MTDAELRVRYLEMIQRIIDRLSNISVIVKGWAITLTAAILALASKDANRSFFVVAYLPSITLWLLDAWYLMLERQYRILFRQNATLDQPITSFHIERPLACRSEKTTYAQCFFSASVAWLYMTLILAILIAILISML